MKILTIVGARPQFVKCGSVSMEIRKDHQEILVHTGQHYDYLMNKVFFEELDIPEPDYNLEVGSGSHCSQTAEILKRLEPILIKEKPDLILVYGDTNSTLASALAAAKMGIKLAHVEAGLRSYDKTMPEEINRILTDHCSDILFCPTQTAVDNLAKEGIVAGVYLTGDVMADTSLYARTKAESSTILERLNLKSKAYLLATIHRAANTDNRDNLENIVNAFCAIEEKIVFPLHPRTEKQLKAFGLYDKLSSKVKLIEPLGYLDFTKLLNHAIKVLTDSGGVQKEAYLFKVPCITLRDTTEWPETVDSGWNKLVGCSVDRIVDNAYKFETSKQYDEVYKSGACRRIGAILVGKK